MSVTCFHPTRYHHDVDDFPNHSRNVTWWLPVSQAGRKRAEKDDRVQRWRSLHKFHFHFPSKSHVTFRHSYYHHCTAAAAHAMWESKTYGYRNVSHLLMEDCLKGKVASRYKISAHSLTQSLICIKLWFKTVKLWDIFSVVDDDAIKSHRHFH